MFNWSASATLAKTLSPSSKVLTDQYGPQQRKTPGAQHYIGLSTLVCVQ